MIYTRKDRSVEVKRKSHVFCVSEEEKKGEIEKRREEKRGEECGEIR